MKPPLIAFGVALLGLGLLACGGVRLVSPVALATRADDQRHGGHAKPAAATGRDLNVPTAGSSEEDPLAPALADLRRLLRIGPHAKGALDEALHQLRARVTPANVVTLASSLSPEELASPTGTAVLERWLTIDPLAASTWLAARPAATDHHAWLAAETLTRRPDLLMAFCEGLDHSSWAQEFLDQSGRELLRRSPAAAVSLAESLPRGDRRNRLLETIAGDWMLREPELARAWITSVEDTALRHRLVVIAAQSHASTDPIGALEWLLAQNADDAVFAQSLRSVASIWLHTAGPETAAKLNHLLATTDEPTDGRTAFP